MYANTNYQRGVSPYPPALGIASGSGMGNNINLQSQSQSQSPYNPYQNTRARGATYGSPTQTSSSQRNMGREVYIPIPDQKWRRMSDIPAAAAAAAVDLNSASGLKGVQPVFWNQGVSGPGTASIQNARGGENRPGQSNGVSEGTGVMVPMDDVALEIGHAQLHQTLLELISLLRSLQHPSASALPPQDSLDRISRLSSIVNIGLSSLSSRTYLDINLLDLPGPSTSVRPETASPVGGTINGKGKGKTRAGEPSQAEKEMDIIRRRRDILIARAKESGRVGGSIAGQRERNKKEGTEEIWHTTSTQEGDGRIRMTATPHGYYAVTTEDPVQRPSSTSSWMSHTRDHQQSMGYFSTPNQHYSSPFDSTPISILGIPNTVPNANLPETTQLDQFFSTPQEVPNPAVATTTLPFFDTPLNLDLPLLKLQLAKSEALALAMHGRCHSCSVVVEGEWMEGPDGPNSLCLSCGPHYARLKQKKKGDQVDEGFKMTPEQRLNVALGMISEEPSTAV